MKWVNSNFELLDLEEIDSYRDIAVLAVKMSGSEATRMVDKELWQYNGP
jgi:hypothetical protein